ATPGVMRLCFGLISAAAIGWWVVRSSFRRVTQAEMARYLEGNEPEFAQLDMSEVDQVAVLVEQRSSPALVQRLTSQATSALDAHGDGRALEWPQLRRALLLLFGVSGAAVMVLGFGPSSWRTLAGGFLIPWAPNEEIVPARTLVVN